MNKLLIASSNPAKIKEYKRLLADSGLELVTPTDVGITETPKETGKDFEENAIIKAKFYAQKSGLPALADDGGLEVEALQGDPGLHTSHMTDEQLINDVITRMQDVPDDKRKCKLSVAIALSTPIGIMTSYSDVEGVVPKKASEKRMVGYPYRSVLYLPNYDKYHIDLTDEEEDILNHRKHALWKIKDMVKELTTL
jgi:XTP/dITP diphosphohydrolase